MVKKLLFYRCTEFTTTTTWWSRGRCTQTCGVWWTWCTSCWSWRTGSAAFTSCCPRPRASRASGCTRTGRATTPLSAACTWALSTGARSPSPRLGICQRQKQMQSEYTHHSRSLPGFCGRFRLFLRRIACGINARAAGRWLPRDLARGKGRCPFFVANKSRLHLNCRVERERNSVRAMRNIAIPTLPVFFILKWRFPFLFAHITNANSKKPLKINMGSNGSIYFLALSFNFFQFYSKIKIMNWWI